MAPRKATKSNAKARPARANASAQSSAPAAGATNAPPAPRRRTITQQNNALSALAQRVGGIQSDGALRTFLEYTNWDVDAAFNLWQQQRRRVLARMAAGANADADADSEDGDEDDEDEMADIPNSDEDEDEEKEDKEKDKEEAHPELEEAMEDANLPFNNNSEQERRDAALALRIHVQQETALEGQAVILSPSEAILVLHLASWDLERASREWRLLLRELAKFDQMRVPIEVIKAKGHAKAVAKAEAAKKKSEDKEEDEEDDEDQEGEEEGEGQEEQGEDEEGGEEVEEEKDDEDKDEDEDEDEDEDDDEEDTEEAKRDQMARDERLAEFVRITDRADWYSLRHFLEEHQWDLVDAIGTWFWTGTPPFQPVPAEYSSVEIRVDVNARAMGFPRGVSWLSASLDQDDNGWGVEPEFYADNVDPEDDEDAPKKKGKATKRAKSPIKKDRPRATGFLLLDEKTARATAKKGIPNPKKFLLEYYVRGRYWFNRYWGDFIWPGVPGRESRGKDDTRVEFDWNNQEHIDKLNNWVRQNIDRITGTIGREASKEWTTAENDFLYRLNEALLNELKRNKPNATEKDLLPMRVSDAKKREWADQMAAQFGLDRRREPSALMTQRTRNRTIVDRFKVTPDAAWFRKLANQKKAKKDDDDGNDGGDDDDQDKDASDIDSDTQRRRAINRERVRNIVKKRKLYADAAAAAKTQKEDSPDGDDAADNDDAEGGGDGGAKAGQKRKRT